MNNLYFEKDGFLFSSIFNYTGAALNKEAIYITDNDTNKYIEYINKNNINKVIIDIGKSNIESLDFLMNIPYIQFLQIRGNIDYSPLYKLQHLKLLSISGSNEIYVDKINGLESFSTAYPNNVKGVDAAKSLKSLKLVGFYSPGNFKNLNFLTRLNNLDTLILGNINISNLEGIQYLINLKVLILENMKKLENISHLSYLSNSLKNLRIESCNKIKDFDVIKYLQVLEFLSIDRVRLVPNLDFVSSLNNLKSFVSNSSNFIDGNLTNLLNVNHVVVYPMRNHYYIIKQNEKLKAKDTDFNYGDRKMGDEDIELWRRIAY